jgi:predicted DsbA family dithiol-disulfide isomerase
VTALTALYVDFQSPFCYRVWRWLSLLEDVRATVEVRPFSLDSAREGDTVWERTSSTWAIELLALGEMAREVGRSAQLRFVDEAFAAVHDTRQLPANPECWLELGASTHLDLDAFTADSERWRAEVGLWHREAVDDLRVSGVPTLVFDTHALWVKLEEDVRDAAAARQLLDGLATMADLPVGAVRRTA